MREEQVVAFFSNDCESDKLILSFQGHKANKNLCKSLAIDFKTVLENIPGVGEIHVSRENRNSKAGSQGFVWTVTFISFWGDAPSLIIDLAQNNNGKDASDRGDNQSTFVSEFLKGQANEFTIEPKKVSGAVIRNISISSEERGKDIFLTELWRSDSTLDGSHYWNSDGGVATYNSVRFEEQQKSMCEGESSLTSIDSVVEGRAGETGIIHVQAKDAYGNSRKIGRDAFILKLTSITNKHIQYRGYVQDNSDGSYTLSYSIPTAGVYDVLISLNNESIKYCIGTFSPFLNDRAYDGTTVYSSLTLCKYSIQEKLHIVHHDLHSLSSTVVDDEHAGLSKAITGLPNGFIIQARGKFGNMLFGRVLGRDRNLGLT